MRWAISIESPQSGFAQAVSFIARRDLQAGTSPRTLCRSLSMLGKADAIVLAVGAEALTDIAPEHVFQELWDRLALPPDLPTGERSTKAVRVQTDTRPF